MTDAALDMRAPVRWRWLAAGVAALIGVGGPVSANAGGSAERMIAAKIGFEAFAAYSVRPMVGEGNQVGPALARVSRDQVAQWWGEERAAARDTDYFVIQRAGGLLIVQTNHPTCHVLLGFSDATAAKGTWGRMMDELGSQTADNPDFRIKPDVFREGEVKGSDLGAVRAPDEKFVQVTQHYTGTLEDGSLRMHAILLGETAQVCEIFPEDCQ